MWLWVWHWTNVVTAWNPKSWSLLRRSLKRVFCRVHVSLAQAKMKEWYAGCPVATCFQSNSSRELLERIAAKTLLAGGLYFFFSRQVLFFFGSWFYAFLFLWFSAFLLFCFSAFLLLCFSASPLFCFSAFLLLCFSASLLFCFSAFLASLLFFCFLLSLLLCFSCFPAFLLFAFPASLLFCFSVFPASLLLYFAPFYFYYSTFSFLQSCVFDALLPAPLLLCFLSLLSLCFSFSFALFCPVCILNETLERP